VAADPVLAQLPAQVSGADVAETPFTAFTGRHALPVKAVKSVGSGPTPGSQLALFTTWSYHALVTNRTGETLELEANHRRHAIVEQTIAELKSAGLAHLPSGHFMANAAWLALSVMAHNLGRAVGQLAGTELERATAATLRSRAFSMPGRLVHTGRRRHLRLPQSWPWADAISNALALTHNPAALLNNTPAPATGSRRSRPTGKIRTPRTRITPDKPEADLSGPYENPGRWIPGLKRGRPSPGAGLCQPSQPLSAF